MASRTNGALAAGDRAKGASARQELFAGLGQLGQSHPQTAQMATKGARNELQRLYMQHGWFEDAAEVARGALEGQPIDEYCANRESVVRQSLARVLLEAGDVEGARVQLNEAIRQSRSFLEGVRVAQDLEPHACEAFGQRGSAPSPVHGGKTPPGR